MGGDAARWGAVAGSAHLMHIGSTIWCTRMPRTWWQGRCAACSSVECGHAAHTILTAHSTAWLARFCTAGAAAL